MTVSSAHHAPRQAGGPDHGGPSPAQADRCLSPARADRGDADAAGIRPRLRSSATGRGPLLTLYLYTSLLVAALTNETESTRMQACLGKQEPGRPASSDWGSTEFPAALSMKLPTRPME